MFTLTATILVIEQVAIGVVGVAAGLVIGYFGFWHGRRVRLMKEMPMIPIRDLKGQNKTTNVSIRNSEQDPKQDTQSLIGIGKRFNRGCLILIRF